MKRIIPILMIAMVGFPVYSCTSNNDVVQQVQEYDYPLMRDVTGSFTPNNSFAFTQPITIQNTDVVLVYRNVGNAWQIIPKTYFLDDGLPNLPNGRELDYNFVFDTQNVQIRTESNFNQSTQMTNTEIADYLTNQTFRIVLVPANANKGGKTEDYSDYNAVVKRYHLDDRHVPLTKIN